MLDELQLIADEEVRAYHIYSEKFRALNPEPERPSPVKQGWEFMAYLLVSIASVLLASMRTAEIFYRSAVFSSSSPVLAYFEAFLAIFTVEGGIVVYAAVMASRSKKISPVVLTIGIILLAAISIVAGLAQSLTLSINVDPQLTDYVYNALIVLIGPGASFAALIGGHILGQQIAMAAKEYEDLLEDYDGQVEEYNLKLKKSWERSEERKSAKKSAITRIMMQEQGILPPEETSLVSGPSHFDDEQHTSNNNAQTETHESENLQRMVVGTSENIPQGEKKNGSEPLPEQTSPQKTVSMKIPASDNVVKGPETDKMDSSESGQNNNGSKKNGKFTELDNVTVKQMQHTITKWLIDNKKTPFDNDLDYQLIAADVKLNPQYVGKIIQQMKVSFSKRL